MTLSESRLDGVARIHRALGHPARLRIAHLLTLQPLSVTDVQSILGLPQAVVSKHLACLYKSRLVERCRSGKRVFYVATRKTLSPELDRLIEYLKQSASDLPVLQEDADALGRATVSTLGRGADEQFSEAHDVRKHIKESEYIGRDSPGFPFNDEFVD